MTDHDTRLAAIENAPHAPEALRERVAEALYRLDFGAGWSEWHRTGPTVRDAYREAADTAITVITTPTTAGTTYVTEERATEHGLERRVLPLERPTPRPRYMDTPPNTERR